MGRLQPTPLPGLHDTKIFYRATCQTDLPNQRFEYMCAFEVPDLSIAPPNGRMIVPAAHYAVFIPLRRHSHPPRHMAVHLEAVGSHLQPQTRAYTRRRALRRTLQPINAQGPIEIWFPIQRASNI